MHSTLKPKKISQPITDFVPELGEGASRDIFSDPIPEGSPLSMSKEGELAATGDGKFCNPVILDPWVVSTGSPFDSSGLSQIKALDSKYGESKLFSGCRLRQFKRMSHWMSFSKCLFNSPC